MQRFTLSIDDELAERFDAYLTEHGYANRSECFRDILRNHFTSEDVKDNPSAECVGVLSYAYNHHERQLGMRARSSPPCTCTPRTKSASRAS